MLFISKRNKGQSRRSTKETCFLLLGLLIAVGCIGGLSGLIYGLVKNNWTGIIGGAVVLGVSIISGILFVFMVKCCFKKDDTNRNSKQQQQHHNGHSSQRKQMQNLHDQNGNSLREINTISTTRKHEPNNISKTKIFSSSIPAGISNHVDHNVDKNTTTPSSKSYNFTYLNESHSSINSNNSRKTNYNRH